MPISLDRHKALFGRPPDQVSGDRGLYSLANEKLAKDMGVRRVILPKPGYVNFHLLMYQRFSATMHHLFSATMYQVFSATMYQRFSATMLHLFSAECTSQPRAAQLLQ